MDKSQKESSDFDLNKSQQIDEDKMMKEIVKKEMLKKIENKINSNDIGFIQNIKQIMKDSKK